MITKLHISGFKNISHESFDLANLNILTGLNTSGKSSVIQALLLLSYYYSNNLFVKEIIKHYKDYEVIRNKYEKSKEVVIQADIHDGDYSLQVTKDNVSFKPKTTNNHFVYEKDLFYLSANRTGQEDLSKYDEDIMIGINGEYVFGYFERKKDIPIFSKLIVDQTHLTLQAQVAYWLRYILDFDITLKTEKVSPTNIKIMYDIEELRDLSAFNIGAGSSYLAKVLIVGLSLHEGSIYIVENPEIHLHPKAQAKLADFFILLANVGIQVILETHSEHIINKLRYLVYKDKIASQSVKLFYKSDIRTSFTNILIGKNGYFQNSDGSRIEFPSGFFDPTLSELLEIL